MSENNVKKQSFFSKMISENPVFGLYLGICSTLAISTSLNNALGMGVGVIVVLVLSNVVISMIAKITPDDIHIPVYIVVIATLVTILEMFMHAYTPDLYTALGAFLSLIVVNCIILGRAEAFASKNSVLDSIIDAFGMGLGFTFSLILISFIRELIGKGAIAIHNPFNPSIVWFSFNNILGDGVFSLFQTPAGAFLVLGFLVAIINTIRLSSAKRKEKKEV